MIPVKERIEYSLKLAHHNLGNFYLTHEQIALLSGLNRSPFPKLLKMSAMTLINDDKVAFNITMSIISFI